MFVTQAQMDEICREDQKRRTRLHREVLRLKRNRKSYIHNKKTNMKLRKTLIVFNNILKRDDFIALYERVPGVLPVKVYPTPTVLTKAQALMQVRLMAKEARQHRVVKIQQNFNALSNDPRLYNVFVVRELQYELRTWKKFFTRPLIQTAYRELTGG